MNVLMLPHKGIQPVKIILPKSIADINFRSDLEDFSIPFDHSIDEEIELIVIDRGYLKERFMGDKSVADFITKKGFPILITDDLVGNLSDDFDTARYPIKTVGVISNEVMVSSVVMGDVLRVVMHSIRNNAPLNVQPAICDLLKKNGDWVLDPDFANQYRRSVGDDTTEIKPGWPLSRRNFLWILALVSIQTCSTSI